MTKQTNKIGLALLVLCFIANIAMGQQVESFRGHKIVRYEDPGARSLPTSGNNANNNRPIESAQRTGNGPADLNGAWKGTYTCSQGLTNLVLSLFTKDGTNVEAIFTFLLGDGADLSVLGSAKYKGTYASKSGRIELKGVEWDQKPSGYVLYDLLGSVNQSGRGMSGTVLGPGCTTFQLEKIRFK